MFTDVRRILTVRFAIDLCLLAALVMWAILVTVWMIDQIAARWALASNLITLATAVGNLCFAGHIFQRLLLATRAERLYPTIKMQVFGEPGRSESKYVGINP